jgi:hypothetical protein
VVEVYASKVAFTMLHVFIIQRKLGFTQWKDSKSICASVAFNHSMQRSSSYGSTTTHMAKGGCRLRRIRLGLHVEDDTVLPG